MRSDPAWSSPSRVNAPSSVIVVLAPFEFVIDPTNTAAPAELAFPELAAVPEPDPLAEASVRVPSHVPEYSATTMDP